MPTNKTARAKQPAKSTSKPRPQRPQLGRIIDDLCNRLSDQMYVAEALQKAARPTGETLVASYPTLKVIELAAAAHTAALKEAWTIALRTRNDYEANVKTFRRARAQIGRVAS